MTGLNLGWLGLYYSTRRTAIIDYADLFILSKVIGLIASATAGSIVILGWLVAAETLFGMWLDVSQKDPVFVRTHLR